ncbi:MAG: guanylate kinase [Deltaproteobacteria bacterium]|jgi:guanylate kinase|nr:guanylate kinase [Deltaproteobacteria bacterium]MCL5880035.1 guanylate kinase [Deltaproteobacteria bacterium]MDA8304108.1 guanylate kinase [Deltaproteobacteria bacterium]
MINNNGNNLPNIDLSLDGYPKGLIIAVSAPSGTGKTTLCNMLTKEFADIKPSISFTTRQKRTGEIDDVSYHFISDEEFDKMIANGEFIEWANVFGKRYGTAYKSISSDNADHLNDTLLEIDVQGVEKLIKYFKGREKSDRLITIFITPPSHADLIDRLRKRGGMSNEELKKRYEISYVELEKSNIYDYIITNDVLDKAYLKLKSIIIAARCRNTKKYKI